MKNQIKGFAIVSCTILAVIMLANQAFLPAAIFLAVGYFSSF